MPGIDRTTILSGPAIVQYGGQSFWSKGDVLVEPVMKTFRPGTAHFGNLDPRPSDRRYEVSFEPAGRFTDALAAVLWPYGAMAIGTSIYGSTDSALVVWARDGTKLTIHNAALTQMPNIRRSIEQTIQASLKFTGIIAKNKATTDADAYYTLATASYPGDAGFSQADIMTLAAPASWGGDSPWDSFYSEGGWEVSFGLQLSEQTADGYGTFDMILQGLDVTVKGVPIGPSVSDILAALKTDQELGTSLASEDDFVIASPVVGGPVVTISKAAMTKSGFVFGAQKKRVGATEWMATRNITAGAADPLFSIAAAE